MTPALKPDAHGEHPIVAWTGIVAVFLATLLILWARYEVHGTRDLEQAFSGSPPSAAAGTLKPSPEADRKARSAAVDEAVATGRWATGFSP